MKAKTIDGINFKTSASGTDANGRWCYVDIWASISTSMYNKSLGSKLYSLSISIMDSGGLIYNGERLMTSTFVLDPTSIVSYEEIINYLIPMIQKETGLTLKIKATSIDIIMASYLYKKVTVITNVGAQTTDIKCEVVKRFMDKSDVSLFERFILGKKMYFYRVEMTPIKPIRENRDKDFLPGFSEEGNDALHSASYHLPFHPDSGDPEMSEQDIWEFIYTKLKDYDPAVKDRQARERNAQKHPWTNRTLWRWYTNKMRFGMYTAIYPFIGSDLSGRTDMLSIEIENDDENGYGINIGFLGVHFYHSNERIMRMVTKALCRNRPTRDRSVPWSEYSKLLETWEKEYKFEYFLDSEWNCKLSITRASGLRWRREFNHGASSKWGWSFNPLRNKLWYII